MRSFIIFLIPLICIGFAAWLEWSSTDAPKERKIHMELFRYGAEPSVIRANRGDDLTFTFKSRDTGHSFLLQDYRIEAKVSPANEKVEIRDPLDAEVPFIDAREVRLKAGLDGWWGRLVSISRFRCHVYCGRMHGFEQGDLIVRPNFLFAGSLGLLIGLVIVSILRALRNDPPDLPPPPTLDLNGRFPFLDGILKWRPLQFLCTLPVMAVFTLVVAAGFFGTKVGGRNFGVMLTWSVWMALLTLLLVPLLGRAWCMVCPLPSLGEYLQRGATVMVRPSKDKNGYGNRFFGLNLRWPKPLRGPWISLLTLLCLGTLSASLAGQPKWTATALLLLFLAATIMPLVWELRAFCRYVCPVATFISLYSPLGRVTVRSRNPEVCAACTKHTCLRGNDRGWACAFGLLVPKIDSNVDCGFCLECFKSCSYDNVSLGLRRGPWSARFQSFGQGWQAIAMVVFGMVYPLTILSPWPAMRDLVNVVDKATWPQFGLYAAALWAITLGIVPLVFWCTTRLGMAWSGKGGHRGPKLFSRATGEIFKATMPALIPLGLSFWATFFIATVMVNFCYILLATSDPLGRGWDLLGTAGLPWVQIWPAAIPWLQAGLVFFGLSMSFRKGFRFWRGITGDGRAALKGFAPTASLMTALAAVMLVYFTNF